MPRTFVQQTVLDVCPLGYKRSFGLIPVVVGNSCWISHNPGYVGKQETGTKRNGILCDINAIQCDIARR